MKKTNKTVKLLAWILALMLALPALTGMAALADDVHVFNETKVVSGDVDGQASAVANDGTASLTVQGSVTNDTTAVSVNAYDGGSVTVETGNVTTENTDPEINPNAVGVFTTDDTSSADVQVGDVTSTDMGVNVNNNGGTVEVTTGDIESVENGLNVGAGNKTEWTDLTAEDFSALALGDANDTWNDGDTLVENFIGADGVRYYRYTHPDGTATYGKSTPVDSKGTTTVESGNVTVKNTEDHWTQGVGVHSNDEGHTVNVIVNGNVNVENKVTDENVQGVNVYANEGNSSLTVDGDITVTGGQWGCAAQANVNEDGGSVNLTVNGEIHAESDGGSALGAGVIGDGSITVQVDDVFAKSTGEEKMTGVQVNTGNDGAIVALEAGEITSDGMGVNVYNAGGDVTVTTGAVKAEEQGVWASGGENNDWDWLQADEFAALNLGAPTRTDSWTNGDGTSVTDEQFVGDGNVIYHHYIYGNGEESFEKQTISASKGTTTVTVNGDVTVDATRNDYWTVGVGGNTSSEQLDNDQKVDVTVNGNVTVKSENGEANGVQAEAHDGDVTITVNGTTDVSGKQYSAGINLYAEDESTAKVIANGDVTVTSEKSSATGVTAYIDEDGYADATIKGNVTAQGDEYSNGIVTDNGGGKINIEVVGDVESTGQGILMVDMKKVQVEALTSSEFPAFNKDEFVRREDGGNGSSDLYCHKEDGKEIYYYATPDGSVYHAYIEHKVEVPAETRVEVKGDVEAKERGVVIELENDKGKMDLIVDGTISGEKSSVVVSKETLSDNLVLTVWEIKANDAGNVAERTVEWTEGDDGIWTETREADRELEKKIQYIIRLEQPTAGSISTAGTTEYEGYNVAKEGDKVVLKLNIPSGYKVVDAFNGTDVKVSLLKDENGEYYIIVPKGGAVNLSVTLEKIPATVPVQQQQKTKMSDEAISEAVETLLTKNDVAEDSTVNVETAANGKKTVVIAPKTESNDGSSTELKATCSADLLKELQTSDVKQIQIVSKSGNATVTLDVKDVLKAVGAGKGANLVVDIEENTSKIDSAKQLLSASYQVLDGAVSVKAMVVDENGNTKALDKANITIHLTLKKVDGMKILFVDEAGNVQETNAKWVDDADGVPGHWEVPYMGQGTFMPVVEK